MFRTDAQHTTPHRTDWAAVNSDEVLATFGDLSTWRKGDRRAPHKPLLVLLALGEWQRKNRGPLAFAAVEPRLQDLPTQFGPPRASSPEEPFWRLKRDGVWELGKLLRAGVTGQFSPDVRAVLAADPGLVARIARSILDANFPETLHADILDAVGLDVAAAEIAPAPGSAARRVRDPRFRDAVMRAYGECCAVCGVGLRFAMTSVVIGVEAAHVMWFQAGGPDDVRNGLALCSLHHKAFDLGAFTVEPGGRVLVSADVCGSGVEEALGRHSGQRVRAPTLEADRPAGEYLEWHRAEVFRGRARG